MQRTYVDAVQRAGGLGLLLAPDDGAVSDPDELLERVDALIFAGGADVDPASYGAQPHPQTGRTWPERDRFEVALARRAVEREMPVLGVCRGMEVLNVSRGGTLEQHLPDALGSENHLREPGAFGEHEVRFEPESLAARVAGGELATVKSHHHQGVDELGEGLVATGWSVADDVVEAIEMPDAGYFLGVLWHPEEDGESHVIDSLVEAGAGVARR